MTKISKKYIKKYLNSCEFFNGCADEEAGIIYNKARWMKKEDSICELHDCISMSDVYIDLYLDEKNYPRTKQNIEKADEELTAISEELSRIGFDFVNSEITDNTDNIFLSFFGQTFGAKTRDKYEKDTLLDIHEAICKHNTMFTVSEGR